MKCTNKTVFMIDRLDLVEMFYNDNRECIIESIKDRLVEFKGCDIGSIEEQTEVKVKIEDCLDCSFRCGVTGAINGEGDFHYSSFLSIAIWDVKEFLSDGWTLSCELMFPLIGTNHGMYEPVWQETDEMSEYLKDLIENDDDLLKQVREYITNKTTQLN